MLWLAFYGDVEESDSNFTRLIYLHSEDNPKLANRVHQKTEQSQFKAAPHEGDGTPWQFKVWGPCRGTADRKAVIIIILSDFTFSHFSNLFKVLLREFFRGRFALPKQVYWLICVKRLRFLIFNGENFQWIQSILGKCWPKIVLIHWV